MNTSRTIIFSMTLILLVSCENQRSDTVLVETQPERVVNALAIVNGVAISKQSFESFLQSKRQPVADNKNYDALLDQYLEREALTTVIEQEDILDKQTIETEVNEFRKEMLISRYFETFLKGKATDVEVRNYYDSHAQQYQEKKAHVAHILLRTKQNMAETERAVKLTTAREAWSKLNAGELFADVAAAYSEDRNSVKNGGEIGWIKQGAIDKRFSEKVFTLKKGEISEPMMTAFGYHIIKVLDEPRVIKRPFESVKGDIRYNLRTKARNAEMERLLSKIEIQVTEK